MKSEKKSEKALSLKREGLSKSARDLLSRVRASPSPEAVFGLEPAAAEAKAHSVIDPLVEGTGLPVARLNQYRWYLAELCRLMRTRSGPDLAYCTEFTIKKWLGFGSEPKGRPEKRHGPGQGIGEGLAEESGQDRGKKPSQDPARVLGEVLEEELRQGLGPELSQDSAEVIGEVIAQELGQDRPEGLA